VIGWWRLDSRRAAHLCRRASRRDHLASRECDDLIPAETQLHPALRNGGRSARIA